MSELENESIGTVPPREPQTSEQVYARQLPGGGKVRVELLVADRGNVAAERLTGRVVMDTQEHPVVLEELHGNESNVVVDELLRIARDNAAIARRVIRQMNTAVRAD